MKTFKSPLLLFAILAIAVFFTACEKDQVAPKSKEDATLELRESVSGAIFTTNAACAGTNVNIFPSKNAVYLDGGPVKEGSAGLPPGNYYVKVTTPDGDLLGYTTTASVVVNPAGEFAACYQLWAILVYPDGITPGYETTSNPGGVYKVWGSKNPEFPPSESKTDNFKVDMDNPPVYYQLDVVKFYDANADGINNDLLPITGWKVRIQNGIDIDRFTPVSVIVAPGTYTVSEYFPIEPNWMPTTATSDGVNIPPNGYVEFGNLCLGAGGGKTLGFWSNKNGQSFVGADDLAMLVALNLRNANGTHFNPGNYSAFRSWLLSANATNMAYMLSAQMAAMNLNVHNGFVNGGALIYAPGATSANALGFATVNNVLAEANWLLGTTGSILADDPLRAHAEALKNALDNANNNYNFVQGAPCPFTFPE